MHNILFVTLTILTLFTGNISIASARSNIDIPVSLENAVAAYKDTGVDAFLPVLFGGSLKLGSNINLVNETDALRKVAKFYGNYIGLEMVDAIQVSDSTRIVFFIMKHLRGPLYGVITTYKTNDDSQEYITEFKIHTEIHQIMPTSFLSRYIKP